MSLAGVKPGDEVVIVTPARTAPVRAKVQRVGRKYAAIGRQLYRLDDGSCKGGYGIAYTVSQWERNELLSRLRDMRLRLDGMSFWGDRCRASNEAVIEATRLLTEAADLLDGKAGTT